MPVLFVAHGNPMHAISDNDITRTWNRVGENLPKAQAIVVISAHWLTDGTRITDAPKHRIIYDFYGFPEELYRVDYPANGTRCKTFLSPISPQNLNKLMYVALSHLFAGPTR